MSDWSPDDTADDEKAYDLPSLGKVVGHLVTIYRTRYDKLMAVAEAAKAWREAESASPYLSTRPEDLELIVEVDRLGAAGQSTPDWVDDTTTPAAETQRRIEALPKAGWDEQDEVKTNA